MKGKGSRGATRFVMPVVLAAGLVLGATVTVPLFYETTIVAGHGRVDSIAMWVAPNPEQSILYITDKTKNCLEKHDPVRNKFLGYLGSTGSGPGQLRYPNGVDVGYNVPTGSGERDLLIVADRDNNRLAIWSVPDETYMGSVSHPDMIEPYGVATYWDEDQFQVFATDNGGPTDDVFVFNIVPQGQGVQGVLQRKIATQTILESLTIDQYHRRILLCDEARSEVMVLDLAGNLLQRFGLGHFVREPEGIQIYDTGNGTGYIVVSDQIASPTEYEVFDRQTFACLGNFSGSTRDTDGIEIVQTALSNLPNGSLFAQNTDRNAHCYDWGAIASALGLQTAFVDYHHRPAARLTLQMPNGGEALQVDSTYTITWTAENAHLADTVRIEYSQDGGATWQVLAAQTANDGEFTWQVRVAPTSTACLRIADARDGRPSDMSDSTFKIIGPPAQIKITGGSCQSGRPSTNLPAALEVKVTDSNGNAVSGALVTFEITAGNGSLSTTGPVRTALNGRAQTLLTLGPHHGANRVTASVTTLDTIVTFEAQADVEEFANNIARDKAAQASRTAGNNVPGRAVDGNDCSFWASGALGNGSQTAWLLVDLAASFAVDRAAIKWDGSFFARKYEVQLSSDSVNWTTVYTQVAGTGGTERFVFPAATARYVRVYMTEAKKNIYRIAELEIAQSAAGDSILLQSPNGGEAWQVDSSYAITWDASRINPGSLVRVEYSADAGASWQVLAANAPNTGSYLWQVNTAPTSTALIRIADAGDRYPIDTGDSTFKIIGPPAQMKVTGGDCQSGRPGTTLPAALTVKVTDRNGNAVPGAAVTFTVSSGAGTLSPAQPVRSGLNGRAASSLTLGPEPGVTKVQARVAGLDTVLLFTARADSQAFAVNAACGKTATASSTNGGNSAARAVDGSECSYWASGPLTTVSTTQWLMVDLQSAQVLTDVAIKWDGNFFATAYEIQLSMDQLGWQTVFAEQAGTGGTVRLELPPITAQYVRVYMTGNRKNCYRIAELEIQSAAPGSQAQGVTSAGEGAAAALQPPGALQLEQNYPNPFNPTTTLTFRVPEAGMVKLQVYNLAGQVIATLVNRWVPAGVHHVTFDASALPTGVYVAVLHSGSFTQTRRLVYMK
ncbi:MAG: phytase [candidate division KSB1 bacterium]|nr:phytase [candidate division KSB1 bacterium]MDZ7273795.1 phytase [candidate division KSB1 bacterium]MDZ7285951.1 phytase [candidate division KSB1 bacterium]MDZ7298983.1 phytase [candidate division KSB1 bacterium]MDZ7309170.1 phytase [candidate division KSB1 bacterium]